ncbi:hypothetical protein [Palleronia caenipelagi]|uniref:Uncharacterized protein n=1 Tax=Palleronia caenipelagi TaxID=2489174 RepID=A0A547Q2V6_9RHOB|nr:hypothetical protein [Palleronia caenipelagi]TRD20722.1 hypothetical protein FEV53_09765 [Palleronia caenipelagi]
MTAEKPRTPFTYKKGHMAQALSIVGEHGIHGFKYTPPASLMAGTSRKSRRIRWSFRSAHQFSAREFEDYMILAYRFGFIERSKYSEYEWGSGLDMSSYSIDPEIVRLTRSGWEYLETFGRPILHKWGHHVSQNIPTVLISALSALATSWVIFKFGANP